MRLALVPLLALLLAACAREPPAPVEAAAGTPPGPTQAADQAATPPTTPPAPAAATLAAANRLPTRIGAWRRLAARPTNDGYAVLYALGEGQGRAALLLAEAPGAPDGPASPPLLRRHPELDQAAPPGPVRATLAIADAPGQRCLVRRISVDAPARRVLDYLCGTAAGGQLLLTRAALPLQRADPAEIADSDTLVGVLLTAATRALAGIDPPLPRLPAGSSGEAFIGAMRLVREEQRNGG